MPNKKETKNTVKTKDIKSVLIVNRGEIACRIIRTLKRLGIKSVAIYSDIDKNALFVERADEAIPLDGIEAKDTYLNTEKIIDVAKRTGVDAIHPGYGFLSENPEFVRRLEQEGIGFIGPSAYSMDAMGDKLKAKQMAEKAGVPMVPGSKELIKDAKHAKTEAKKIGYPVLLKAVAGGGGKGIRIVRKEDEMEELLADCRYEAKTIYKNDQMLLEKYIENPRHIEIQIAADKHGNVVCLGERECSIQRCNQKVIEECPSTLVNDDMRQKMYASAVALAKECKYFSVGTFEFIADNDRNFYFLEMNTRLQVEHPVTECVIRAKGQPLDLVEVMIDIECGKKLPFTQKDITLVGNAIECRICAEQPSRNYLPSTGRIVHYIIPERSANVRVETGVQLGDEITPYYDSMFAKLITYGSTRNEAIETMKRALGQYEIGGIETNILLLESIIRQNCFAEGKLTTGFIKRHYPHGFNSLPLNEASKKAFIIASVVCFLRHEMHNYDINQTRRLPRDTQISDLCIKIDNDNYLVEVKEFADNFISVKYNDIIMTAKYNADFTMRTLYGVLDGKHEFAVRIKKGNAGALKMECSGLVAQVKSMTTEQAELEMYMPECKCDHDDDVVKAPITGKITKMKVKSGDKVEVGQHLFSIEAMKMENVVVAEKSGIIEAMVCKLNEQVIAGTTILKFVKE